MYILFKGVNSKHLRETKSSSSCLPISCIETAVKHMKVWKDRVTNFIKQNKNIQKQLLKAGYKQFFTEIGLEFKKVFQIENLPRKTSSYQFHGVWSRLVVVMPLRFCVIQRRRYLELHRHRTCPMCSQTVKQKSKAIATRSFCPF